MTNSAGDRIASEVCKVSTSYSHSDLLGKKQPKYRAKNA
jgi:hypothetical protein